MKLSALISELQSLLDDHGDCDVVETADGVESELSGAKFLPEGERCGWAYAPENPAIARVIIY